MNDEVLERFGERRVVSGPRHRGHDRAARSAVHSSGQPDEFHRGELSIEMSPRPHPVAVIEPGRQVTASPTAASSADFESPTNP
ncbi:MAG: hypothetical protein OES13_09985 [Acidimicrobiia bacterium]|nr:hypothetical protein [Acidimicrobiia bacterium]